tara:strand:- start:90 stop:587 length:498 start_codon:yes stop_codon:yes gene_type:complete
MSTKLFIDSISKNEINLNLKKLESDSIELNEDFLFDFFVNNEILEQSLDIKEIDLIRPNWGEIQMKSTDSLKGVKKEKYLKILKESIKTNSLKKLDKFLYNNGITSNNLGDRSKCPEKVKEIIEKLQKWNKKKNYNLYQKEFNDIIVFLNIRIEKREKILIEFID